MIFIYFGILLNKKKKKKKNTVFIIHLHTQIVFFSFSFFFVCRVTTINRKIYPKEKKTDRVKSFSSRPLSLSLSQSIYRSFCFQLIDNGFFRQIKNRFIDNLSNICMYVCIKFCHTFDRRCLISSTSNIKQHHHYQTSNWAIIHNSLDNIEYIQRKYKKKG